jgi:hypothetical protein
MAAAVAMVIAMGCATPVPPTSGPYAVRAQIESDSPDVIVQRRTVDGDWSVACDRPCDRMLRTRFLYRINGENIPASPAFTLTH